MAIDLDRFFTRAEELLQPFVNLVDYPSFYNLADLGSAYITTEERSARPDKYVVDLPVKTARAPMSCDDCDAQGTEGPVLASDDVCRALATEFGLTFKNYEPSEKGWGSFTFLV